MKPDTTPAPASPGARHGEVLDSITSTVLGNNILLIATLALIVLTAVWVVRAIVRLSKSERPDDPLSNLGMAIGLGWSSEAVWVLTGTGGANLALPFRIALFAIFEVTLIVFMIRAKRNMKTIGKPGKSGRNAWIVAGGMSLVAVTIANNPGEGFLRLLVPLMLTMMWWDGLVGEGGAEGDEDDGGTFNWTPRKILIRMGAITPSKKDVKTVHRERLTQRMTDLYYAMLYGPEGKRAKVKTRLARLTLDADDEIIRTVLARVGRTSWVEAKPLPYALTQQAAGTVAQEITQPATQEIAQSYAPRKAAVQVAPARRAKPATQPVSSDYAGDEDGGTQAAQDVLSGRAESIRKTAEKYGVSEGTVRNRIKDLRKLPEIAQPITQQPTNGHQFADADN